MVEGLKEFFEELEDSRQDWKIIYNRLKMLSKVFLFRVNDKPKLVVLGSFKIKFITIF